jgi:hypothetical protein
MRDFVFDFLPRMKFLATLVVAGSAASVAELVAFFELNNSSTTTTSTPIESVKVSELKDLFEEDPVASFAATVFADAVPEGKVEETVEFFELLGNQTTSSSTSSPVVTTGTPTKCLGWDCSTQPAVSSEMANLTPEIVESEETVKNEEIESRTETPTSSTISANYFSVVGASTVPPSMLRGRPTYIRTIELTVDNGVVRVCTTLGCRSFQQ